MNGFTGTMVLARLAARRDRLRLGVWVVSLALFAGLTTALWADQFGATGDMVQEARLAAASPGIRILGLATGASVGAYATMRNFVLLACLAALMSVFTVVRHTRQGEETGRSELLGAGGVGRHAALAAALLVAVLADAALALTLALALLAAGQPAVGAFAAGAAVGAVGAVFGGVGAVTSQLSSTTRGASGLAAAALGASFLAAGTANMAGPVDRSGVSVDAGWPAWLSPIGWGQQMRPFAGDRWWPLALATTALVTCAVMAGLLAARRDFGQGLLPQRRGRARAPRTLHSPLGLAWRLQRGVLAGWAVAMLGFGLVMGSMIDQVRASTGSGRDWYTRVGGSAQILDAYRASVLQMAAMGAAIYVVQVLLRMAGEDVDGTVEAVLSTATGRTRWALAHAVNATVGVTILLGLFAVGVGLAAGAVLGDPVHEVAVLVPATAAQLPAVLAVGAAVLALVATQRRRAVGPAWVLLIACILVGPMFGTTFSLPQWVQDLSPFAHAPKAPAVAITAMPVLTTLAAAGVLLAAALIWLRRRDLALPA